MSPQTRPDLTGTHRDEVWNGGAGLDPRRSAQDLEAAVGVALGRNSRLHGHHIRVTAGALGLVTLTGAVATRELQREVELSCWTVPGIWTLHDELGVGRSAVER